MPNVLKSKYQINVQGNTLYITDISGAYDASDNIGGWGSPNSALNQSAICCLVQRVVGTTAASLVATSNQSVYDPTAIASKQTQFTFAVGTDGHIKIYLFRLPVSLDGSTTVESTNLSDGNFFYWDNASHTIWQRISGVPTPKALEDIIGNINTVNSLCEALIFPALAIKHNSLYRHYTEKRDVDCHAGDKLFYEVQHLRLDLYGAQGCFRSGLVTKAEDIINTLLKKYDLVV